MLNASGCAGVDYREWRIDFAVLKNSEEGGISACATIVKTGVVGCKITRIGHCSVESMFNELRAHAVQWIDARDNRGPLS